MRNKRQVLRKTLLLYLVALSLLLAKPANCQEETLIHEYWENYDAWLGLWSQYFANISGSANYAAQGQTFNISTTDVTITRVSLLIIANQGTPNNTLVVALFALNETGRVFGVNATPTQPFGKGTELAVSDGQIIVGGSPTEYTFNFTGDNQYVMQAGTNYGLAVYVDVVNVLDGSNYYGIAANNGGDHWGNRLTQYNGTWVGVSSYDTYFRLYGIESEAEEAPFSATSIASPYAYAAITIMSLALIIGVGAALLSSFASKDVAPMIPVIIIGVAILIVLFIALSLFNAFSGL